MTGPDHIPLAGAREECFGVSGPQELVISNHKTWGFGKLLKVLSEGYIRVSPRGWGGVEWGGVEKLFITRPLKKLHQEFMYL